MVMEYLQMLGLSLNSDKSQLPPSQQITFLGVKLDSDDGGMSLGSEGYCPETMPVTVHGTEECACSPVSEAAGPHGCCILGGTPWPSRYGSSAKWYLPKYTQYWTGENLSLCHLCAYEPSNSGPYPRICAEVYD